MNRVELMGRLTKDPDIRYTADQVCIATFYVAIDRPHKTGADKVTDYPCVKCFGRQAEAVEKYLKKGRQVTVSGSLQTGSYQGKNGKVYTTDVVAESVEFMQDKPKQEIPQPAPRQEQFASLDEDVPF